METPIDHTTTIDNLLEDRKPFGTAAHLPGLAWRLKIKLEGITDECWDDAPRSERHEAMQRLGDELQRAGHWMQQMAVTEAQVVEGLSAQECEGRWPQISTRTAARWRAEFAAGFDKRAWDGLSELGRRTVNALDELRPENAPPRPPNNTEVLIDAMRHWPELTPSTTSGDGPV